MNKKFLFNTLRVIISLGFITLLIWLMRNNIGEVAFTLKSANRLILLVSFLFFILSIALLAMRFQILMKVHDLRMPLKKVIYLTFLGLFFNNFLPTSAGGDLVKAYYAAKITGKKMPAFTCVLLDRLLGSFTLVLMAAISAIFVKKILLNRGISNFIIIALLVFIAILSLLFSKRIAKKIPFVAAPLKKFNLKNQMANFYVLIHDYRKHPFIILKAVLISLGLQVVSFYCVYLMSRSLQFDIPLLMMFLLMPLIIIISMAPSINGLGVREGSFVFFFGPLIGREGAFALSILWLGFYFASSIIGGILYLFNKEPYKDILKEV